MDDFGSFKGDNRGAQEDGGTFRTSQMIRVSNQDERQLLSDEFKLGVSKINDTIARTASESEHEVLPTAAGLNVSGAASDGLFFGAAPNLKYNLTISASDDGHLTVSGTHAKFPSLEVWAYQDGKAPQRVYVYNAPASSFVEGSFHIFQTVPVSPK